MIGGGGHGRGARVKCYRGRKLGPDEGGSKRILWGIIWATDVEKIQESWNFLEEMKCFMRESSAS